jgi:hypothetical protein
MGFNREVFLALLIGLTIGWLSRFFSFSSHQQTVTRTLADELIYEQWLYVKNELAVANELGKEYVKFYFNPMRTTLRNLNSTGYLYAYNLQDDECIQNLSNTKEGSVEYYSILSRNDCHRRFDPHLKVFVTKREVTNKQEI